MEKMKNPEQRWHDMGGFPAGQIDKAQHDFSIWEKRVSSLNLNSAPPVAAVQLVVAHIELAPSAANAMSMLQAMDELRRCGL